VVVCASLALSSFTVRAFAAPPHVTKATPDNGDSDVDPGTKELRIEFDQDMSHTGHSLCGGGPAFPEIDGKPHWADQRVFIIPVKLKPNHQYSFSVNCPAATNFRSSAGEPAEMYPISFKTGAAGKRKSGTKLSAETNR